MQGEDRVLHYECLHLTEGGESKDDKNRKFNSKVSSWREHFLHFTLDYPAILQNGERVSHVVVGLERRRWVLGSNPDQVEELDRALRSEGSDYYCKRSLEVSSLFRCATFGFLKDSGENVLKSFFELDPAGEICSCWNSLYHNYDEDGREVVETPSLKEKREKFIDPTLEMLAPLKGQYITRTGCLDAAPKKLDMTEAVQIVQEKLKSQSIHR